MRARDGRAFLRNDDLRGHRFIERHTRALDLHDEVSCLLCTDGLTNVLPKEKIEEIFTKGGFYDIPDRLVDAANAGGGPDNITALLLGVEPLEVKHG